MQQSTTKHKAQALLEFFDIPTKVPLGLGMEDDKRGPVAIVCWREWLNSPKKKLEGCCICVPLTK